MDPKGKSLVPGCIGDLVRFTCNLQDNNLPSLKQLYYDWNDNSSLLFFTSSGEISLNSKLGPTWCVQQEYLGNDSSLKNLHDHNASILPQLSKAELAVKNFY